jgi:hypothetical protein
MNVSDPNILDDIDGSGMYSRSTFIGSEPMLINPQILGRMEEELNVPNLSNNQTIGDTLYWVYDDIFLPNLFPIIVISVLMIYLLIKYIIKKDSDEQFEKDIMKKIEDDDNHKTKSHKHNDRAERNNDNRHAVGNNRVKRRIHHDDIDIDSEVSKMFDDDINTIDDIDIGLELDL